MSGESLWPQITIWEEKKKSMQVEAERGVKRGSDCKRTEFEWTEKKTAVKDQGREKKGSDRSRGRKCWSNKGARCYMRDFVAILASELVTTTQGHTVSDSRLTSLSPSVVQHAFSISFLREVGIKSFCRCTVDV